MIPTTQPLPLQAPVLSKRSENRRENLRRLIEDADGPKNLAAKLGYANPSFLVQMAGPHPTREVTEKTARRFEEKLGLPDGSLDWPVESKGKLGVVVKTVAAKGPVSAPASGDTAMSMDIIRMVGQVCASEGVQLPPVKFSDVVQFALLQAIESGRPPSEEAMKRLLALVSK